MGDKKKKQKTNPKKKANLMVDECAYPLLFVKGIQKIAKVKTAESLAGRRGVKDKDLYVMSNAQDMHVITQNFKDFKNFPQRPTDVGVIGYTAMSPAVANHILHLISSEQHNGLYGKSIEVDNQGVKIRKNCKL